MKKYLFFILLFSTQVFCQPGRLKHEEPLFVPQLKATIIITPLTDSIISFDYLYRIPYDQLIFEKDENEFVASVRILVEVYKNEDLIQRDFKDKKIVANDFKSTQSRTASFQGYAKFDLEADEYIIKGVISDLYSGKDIPILPEKVDGNESLRMEIFNPILVGFSDGNCLNDSLPLVINQNGSIPFSQQNFQMIFPVADTTVDNITIKLKNGDNELPEEIISESFYSGISLNDCGEQIFLQKNDQSQKTKNFILKNFNNKLKEGLLQASIIIDNDREREFPINVIWFNKPFSLRNSEIAIQMLKYIEKDDVISKLLDYDEEKYPEELFQYWKKFDPTPETEYNELMDEYYSRIDYAAMEFRDISRKSGISTDRGKVYIKYGKPDKIERSSNSLGYIVETWTYQNLNQKFLFVDRQGTGNFILVEG